MLAAAYLTLVLTPLVLCVALAVLRLHRAVVRAGEADQVAASSTDAPSGPHAPASAARPRPSAMRRRGVAWLRARTPRPRAPRLPALAPRLDRARLAVRRRHRCPHCAERIRVEAHVCRFCGLLLPPTVAVASSEPTLPRERPQRSQHARPSRRFERPGRQGDHSAQSAVAQPFGLSALDAGSPIDADYPAALEPITLAGRRPRGTSAAPPSLAAR